MLQQFNINTNPQHLKAISEEKINDYLSLYDLSKEEESLIKSLIKSTLMTLLRQRGN